MNSQNPYGGYTAPSPRGTGRGGASLPNRPPVPLGHGGSAVGGPMSGSGYGSRPPPPPPPMIPRPPYGQGYGGSGGANEGYGAGSMSAGMGRGPPPPMMGGGPGRPPNVPPPTTYGSGPVMGYDSGPADNGYGGPASRFEPNAGPNMRPIGMGGPPNQYGGSYGVGGGGNGWNDDGPQQPRKRSRTDHHGGGGGGGGERGGKGGEQEYSDFLKERLKRERPGRVLFVRNIDFQANVPELRSQFESFGEVKTWFDLIAKRGLAFVTYFDLRSAETAKDALQSYRINGRELDVHYSLPRESELSKRCDRDKDQGTLLVFLRGGPPDLSDDEISGIFSQFGEVRGIRPNENYTGRYLDFFDSRATKRAYDSLVNTPYRGGTWDLSFEWDLGMEDRMPDMQKHERDRERLRSIGYQPGEAGPRPGAEGSQERNVNNYGSNYGRGASQEAGYGGSYGGGGSSKGGAYGQYENQQSSGYGPPPSGNGSYGGGGGVKRGYDYDNSSSREPPMRRWGQPASNNNNNNGPGRQGGYGASPVTSQAGSRPIAGLPHSQTAFSPPSANANVGAGGDRLEQAQKVQQLLASLKSAGAGANAGSPANDSRSAAAPAPNGSGGGNPALPSNIAALLQLAQNKSNGGQK